jgi:hypothetical protein
VDEKARFFPAKYLLTYKLHGDNIYAGKRNGESYHGGFK